MDMPAELPPALKRKRRKPCKALPATQAERDAIHFKGIKVEFDWSNDEWAAAYLPYVRLAIGALAFDDDKLKLVTQKMFKDGNGPDFLEGLTLTKRQFESLLETLEVALTRLFLLAERLGYSPDNPPPPAAVN